MKKFLLPALVLVLGLFVLAACGGSNNDTQGQDSRLVGMWSFEFEGMVSPDAYDFRADGTGFRWPGTDAQDTFDWHTDGNNLYINITSGFILTIGGVDVEEWTFSISGNTLTLTSRQVPGHVEVFVRQ
ncbi:MAG: DUF5640 domain-containing protein [Defluviitaleaceae bacterium]|nr:DUF5640 domain-containing protein [Defluviitaleaceae bacterium]